MAEYVQCVFNIVCVCVYFIYIIYIRTYVLHVCMGWPQTQHNGDACSYVHIRMHACMGCMGMRSCALNRIKHRPCFGIDKLELHVRRRAS